MGQEGRSDKEIRPKMSEELSTAGVYKGQRSEELSTVGVYKEINVFITTLGG